MFDLLKASDLGVMYHVTIQSSASELGNVTQFYKNSKNDILAKISHLSCDLDEREFELALAKPLLPIGFKIKPDSVPVNQAVQILRPTIPQQQKYVQKLETQKSNNANIYEEQQSLVLQEKIAHAQNIASDAENLSDLLAKIQAFDSGLESQKFSAKTLIYDDAHAIDILWINECVSHDDDKNNKIMSDVAGSMIVNLFDTLGYGRTLEKNNGKIGFSALSFWAISDKHTQSEFQICLPLIKRLIYFLNPKKIILSGDMTLKYLCNTDNYDVLEQHGKKFLLSIDDKNFDCFATFNLSYILRSEVIKKLFWFDLLQILHDN